MQVKRVVLGDLVAMGDEQRGAADEPVTVFDCHPLFGQLAAPAARANGDDNDMRACGYYAYTRDDFELCREEAAAEHRQEVADLPAYYR